MKELIEKMLRVIERNYKDCEPLGEYAKNCAVVATKHFSDQWIKVDDRLPEEETGVLVYSSNFKAQSIKHSTAYFAIGEFICDDCAIRCGDVTHWMPLPEPPKQ